MINMKRLRDFFGNDTDAISEFLQCFIESMDNLLNTINQAIENEDIEMARTALHQLKGSASNGGFTKITNFCGLAEENISNLDWEKMRAIYDDLKKEFTKLNEEFLNNFKTR